MYKRQGWQGRWPSSTTQFVVGAVGESDLELLNVTHHLTRTAGLKRAYFSAFRPIEDTPLSDQPAENPWRQHRLYQASYLFRDYGFDLEEMPFDADGRLPLDTDPKRAWAEANLRETPVEVNRAEREELLRVPGIGPKGAEAVSYTHLDVYKRQLYFTAKSNFTGDGGLVRPSELFSFSGGAFSGPLWKAKDHGLNQVVDLSLIHI